GRGEDEVAPEGQQLLSPLHGPQHRPAIDRADGMQPEQERGHHAEVAPPAAHGPEEVAVVLGVGGDEATVRQHHIHAEQVVDSQAVGACEIADAAAQGEAADAGGGDEAAGGGQAEGMGGVIDVAPDAAALDAHGAVGGIDADALPAPQVDDQAVLAGAQAGAVVPAAAHGEGELVLAGEVDRGDDVGDVGAAGDERGPAVDHGVVDATGLVVARVGRLNQLAAQQSAQALYGGV